MAKLALLHTNDIHSHFENWNSIETWMKERKAALLDEGYDDVICIDAGDFCDKVHPLTEATNSQINIEKMNAVYDYVTLGNNEGLSHQHHRLQELYHQFTGECVMSHMYDKETNQRVDFATPMAYRTLGDGTTVAFLGGTARYPKSYEPLGWDLTEPIAEFQHLYATMPKADHYILISHFGRYKDHEIAQQCPWLDVIIGGHTHHLYEEGKWDNGVLLTSCQKYGHYVGEIHLDFEHHNYTAQTFCVSDWNKTQEQLDKTMAEIRLGEQLLEEVVYGTAPFSILPIDLLQATEKVLAEHYHYDAVILNEGMFVETLPKGPVTKATWHRVLPHPLHLMDLTISGAELKRLLFEIEKNRHYLRRFHLIGMGFRGKEFGRIATYGLSRQEETWYFNGYPIKDDQIYHILTLDHYEFVPFFPTIAYAGKTTYDMSAFFRDKVAQLTPQIIQQYQQEKQDGK